VQKAVDKADRDRFSIYAPKSMDEIEYKIAFEQCKTVRSRKKYRNGKIKMAVKMPTVSAKQTKNKGKEEEQHEHMLAKSAEAISPLTAMTTSDGVSAAACLKQLVDARLIDSIEWDTIYPSPRRSASDADSHELIRLRLYKGDCLQSLSVLEHDRNINSDSIRAVKQHLSSLALRQLTGPGAPALSEQTFQNVKLLVEKRRVSSASATNNL